MADPPYDPGSDLSSDELKVPTQSIPIDISPVSSSSQMSKKKRKRNERSEASIGTPLSAESLRAGGARKQKPRELFSFSLPMSTGLSQEVDDFVLSSVPSTPISSGPVSKPRKIPYGMKKRGTGRGRKNTVFKNLG